MPVTVLLCEGVAESPDARVLNKLLAGFCTIEPAGSKYGMDFRILARRQVSTTATVMGLRDADFDREWNSPVDKPAPWTKRMAGGDVESLGWWWSRKEIENYLIDPEVVSRALGPRAPDAVEYRSALDRAARVLSEYTAARAALSSCRLTVKQLPNRWGQPRGGDRHRYPERLTKSACVKEIKRIVRIHTRGTLPEPKQVVARYRALRPYYQPGGNRRRDYLYTYAGKDLLVCMNDDLGALGFGSFSAFRERILLGIRDTADDIATWLPKWEALRNHVRTYMS